MPFKIKKLQDRKKSSLIHNLRSLRERTSLRRFFVFFPKKFKFLASFHEKTSNRFRWINILMGIFLVIVGSFVVFKVTFGLYDFIYNFNLRDFLFSFATDLDKDENGNTNILVLGTGGLRHESPDLTDSQIIVSIAPDGAVTMFSVPRDLHIAKTGSTRVNELFHNYKSRFIYQDGYEKEEAANLALEKLSATFENTFDIDLQYYVKVDFESVEQIVDILDGIEIDVEKTINDPSYPASYGWGYDPFYLKAGKQVLDGKTALKYARSRKTTSDFDRSRRQQKIIFALKEKALAKDVLTSASKLQSIFQTLEEHISTDLEWHEILTLARISTEISKDQIVSKVIHDDPTQEGGFLYTPDRTLYNGAFVLVPSGGDFTEIQKYLDLLFNHRKMYLEKGQIAILNGSQLPGIATKTYQYLNSFGFDIEKVANTKDREIMNETVLRVSDPEKFSETIATLKQFFGDIPVKPLFSDTNFEETGTEESETTSELIEIEVVLGQDFSFQKLAD